jgi:hypothetical protein
VVWQGRRGNSPPYADHFHILEILNCHQHSFRLRHPQLAGDQAGQEGVAELGKRINSPLVVLHDLEKWLRNACVSIH